MSACAGDTVRPKRRSASSVRQDVRAVLYSVSGYTTFPLLPCSPIFAQVETKQSSVHENSAACNGYCQLQKTNSRTSANSGWGHSITGIRRPQPRVMSIKNCRKNTGRRWQRPASPPGLLIAKPSRGARGPLRAIPLRLRAAARRMASGWPVSRRRRGLRVVAIARVVVIVVGRRRDAPTGPSPALCRRVQGHDLVAQAERPSQVAGVLVCLRSLPLPFLPASPKCIRAAARRRRGRA